MAPDHSPQDHHPEPDRRLWLLLGIVVVCLTIFAVRLAQIQYHQTPPGESSSLTRYLKGWDRPWSPRRTQFMLALVTAVGLGVAIVGCGFYRRRAARQSAVDVGHSRP